MSSFRTLSQLSHGRLGEISTPNGTVETPAFFPVLNFIGGPTVNSGGIWSRTRNRLFASPELQGSLFQAMDFMNFNLGSNDLNEWREKPMQEWYPEFSEPLFVDSGGFSLMNSEKFGEAPEDGGNENEYGIYTNPQSILDLQQDYGADIIATLDFPIPEGLKRSERERRMRQSIDSARECLELLDERDWDPTVYVAIHGHDHEMINWYVSKVLEETKDAATNVDGFAIGSLVPLRSKTDMLVDIVQGAKDAIPESRADEFGLHVFGVTGRVCSLLALLGVDSFDSSAYVQGARYKKLIHPETWERISINDIDDPSWLDEVAFEGISLEKAQSVLGSDESYVEVEGMMKSDIYAMIAQHNFRMYNQELEQTRRAIEDERLLDYVADVAEQKREVKRGLKHAQLRDDELLRRLEDAGYDHLVAGPGVKTFQSQLGAFDPNVDSSERKSRTISLEHGPSDFNIFHRDYTVPKGKDILLVIPCSQQKPYGESRTQRVVLDAVEPYRERIEKVTVSGLYGPVPEGFETEQCVLEYEYVLTTADDEQLERVSARVAEFLEEHADEVSHVVGYATSKAYRVAIESAFDRAGVGGEIPGALLPRDLIARQLTEHFRNENLEQLSTYLDDEMQSGVQPSR